MKRKMKYKKIKREFIFQHLVYATGLLTASEL